MEEISNLVERSNGRNNRYGNDICWWKFIASKSSKSLHKSIGFDSSIQNSWIRA